MSDQAGQKVVPFTASQLRAMTSKVSGDPSAYLSELERAYGLLVTAIGDGPAGKVKAHELSQRLAEHAKWL